MVMNKLIFFELNEVPTAIVDYYIKIRPKSWLARNFNALNKYETYSENKGHLSPWNTWPTVHRGVPSDKHFIADFNQDLSEVDDEFPPVWKILSEKGIKVGLFGSLHSYPLPENVEDYAFYVPDVFSPHYDTFPKNIEAFQKFNLTLSRMSPRNVDTSLPIKDTLRFVSNSGKLGVKLKTFKNLGQQLIEEKINSWKTVRRRTYQSVIAFDIFLKQLKVKKPDFVTFFTNHVASSMHRYWAASFPEEYENNKYDTEWIETYSNEICFAMDQTDQMLNRLGKFVDANPEYKLMITSSMGQEAVECEPWETQLYVKDLDKFFKYLGVTNSDDYEILPAMIPQLNFKVAGHLANDVKKKLDSFKVNGETVKYREQGKAFYSVDLGHHNLKESQIEIDKILHNIDEVGLTNMVIEDKSSSTAYHIPEGHMYIYHPSNQANPEYDSQIYSCDIASIILNNFGIQRKEYMNKTELISL